jgi:hypothetical protein
MHGRDPARNEHKLSAGLNRPGLGADLRFRRLGRTMVEPSKQVEAAARLSPEEPVEKAIVAFPVGAKLNGFPWSILGALVGGAVALAIGGATLIPAGAFLGACFALLAAFYVRERVSKEPRDPHRLPGGFRVILGVTSRRLLAVPGQTPSRATHIAEFALRSIERVTVSDERKLGVSLSRLTVDMRDATRIDARVVNPKTAHAFAQMLRASAP